MESARLAALTEWIAAHPLPAGLLIAAVALLDALPVAGMVVPSMAILFAVGALMGLGVLDPAWIIACAALGAFIGDTLGYALGRRYGQRLRTMWPFSRHPQWLERGERLFQRHAAWGVISGRQIGAIRPFVPAIAGMLGMPVRHFLLAASVSALAWALVYLAPGWLLGRSWELISAVAGRLGLLLLLLLVVLGASIWLTRRIYGWAAPRVGGWLELATAWARAHPRGGKLLRGLLDPKAPESPALILFALALLAATAGGLSLLAATAGEEGAPAADAQFAAALRALSHPFADQLALQLLPLTGAGFALASLLPGLIWLAHRGHRLALQHAVGALVAAALAALLLTTLRLPAPLPGLHSEGFAPIATGPLIAAAGWSLFAALMADEMPRKPRAWPYVLAVLVVLGSALPRLYLGLHWGSAVLASALLGAAIGALFGIAYRRHQRGRFWQQPLRRAQLGGASLLALIWLALAPAMPEALLPTPPPKPLPADWTLPGRGVLPAQREDFAEARRWPLQLHWLGDPQTLAATLVAAGWQRVEPAQGVALLGGFDFRASTAAPPYLPLSHDGRTEALLLRRAASEGEWQLRLWATPWRDTEGRVLHLGHLGRFVEDRPLGLWRRWRLLGDEDEGQRTLHGILPIAPAAGARG